MSGNKTENDNSNFGRFDFVGRIGLFGGISLILVVASLIFIAIRGISYGIDFKGGTEIQSDQHGNDHKLMESHAELVIESTLGINSIS